MPRISVFTATYNRPECIEGLLQSLRLQTFRDFEVIISDDGSRRSPYQAVKKFEGKLDIKYIWQRDKPFNQSEARNLAIKLSYGEILLWSDDDVFYMPRCLEYHHKRHLAEKRIMVYSFKRVLSKAFDPTSIGQYILKEYPKHSSPHPRNFVGGCLPQQGFSIRREEILAVNGYDLDYSGYYGCEDTDLSRRLLKNGVKPVFAPECVILLIPGVHHPKPFYARNSQLRRQKIAKGELAACKRGIKILES